MFNKKKRINLTTKEFNKEMKYVKEFCTIRYEEPHGCLCNYAYIVDKISKVELTFKHPVKGACTFICDKASSAIVHQKQGVEAYSTLQKYYKIPHVAKKNEAMFSVSGILYSNSEFEGTRQHAYGYDMNSAFSWGMLQRMPKDTEKGPINYNKRTQEYTFREVKSTEIGFGPDGELMMPGQKAVYIFKAEESPFKRFVEVWYNKKKNAKNKIEKTAAKDMLVMAVGFMQRHNFWYRAAIIGYCNNKINSIIRRYPDNVLISNTDSIVSTCRIPEIEENLGLEVGQWKFEHDDVIAYNGLNYQWGSTLPTYRGIPKGWFKQFEEENGRSWDILKDQLPANMNIYEFDKNKLKLVKRG